MAWWLLAWWGDGNCYYRRWWILSTVQNIKKLLDESLSAYVSRDKNKALSLVTIAYLDKYEYIEDAISQKDNILKENVDLALRSDLDKISSLFN